MHSHIIIFLLLISTISFTLAGYVVTKPGTGSILKKGETATCIWSVLVPTDKTVDVTLVRGAASNLQPFKVLCKDVPPQAGKCQFTVGNWPSGFDYAIIVGKNPLYYGYSSFFTIISEGKLPDKKGCPNFGGQNCPQALPCCSASGYCGATPQHCGNGCVAKFSFNGKCIQPGKQPLPTLPKPGLCGNKKCTRAAPCCSKSNKCGKTKNYCGKGCQPKKSFGGKCLVK